jgi:hypothetical protein
LRFINRGAGHDQQAGNGDGDLMSTIVMSLCWPLQMPPTAKAVLISLADNANDHGACWPSLATISDRTCFSERAVQSAIKWLEASGVVVADRSNGRHTRYQINPNSFQPPQEPHPRISRTPAADASTPAGGASVPPQEMRQPPQEVPTNRKEPSVEPSKNRHKADAYSALDALIVAGVTERVAEDWLLLRKKKKAEPTQTAIEGVLAQIALANLTADQGIRMCCERGWQGFRADWVRDDRRQPVRPLERQSRHSGFENMDYTQGVKADGTFN